MIHQNLSTLRKLMLLKGATGGSKAIEATATGNPLAFITDKAKPLKSLLIPFTPKQSGTGDPSPSNIRSILPWNGLTVFGGGKNLFDESKYQHIYTDPDYIWEGVPYRCKYIQLSPNTNYTISSRAGTASNEIVLINNRQQPNIIPFFDLRNASQTITFKTHETGRLYIWSINGDDVSTYNRIKECKIQIEVGSAESAYEPYRPITDTDIVFTFPCYGGTLDVVSGVLTVEWALFTAKWKDGINASDRGNNIRKQFTMPVTFVNATEQVTAYCDVARWRWNFESDDVHFFANGNNSYVFLPEDTDGELEFHIVGKLATPQEIQLTPAQITALIGNNTIWSDADGSMTAVYLKKG